MPRDPFPGYYISQTTFTDVANHNERDPRGYLDARKINYVVRGDAARRRGVKVGDFVAVHSKRTHKSVFAIVGDTGNPTGDEGSLHLLQELGYPFHDGVSDSVTRPMAGKFLADTPSARSAYPMILASSCRTAARPNCRRR